MCAGQEVEKAQVFKRASRQSVVNLRIAFLTHLHSDHTAGYPDLILSPWAVGRNRPLEVYGPKGLKDMTEYILKAYREDKDTARGQRALRSIRLCRRV